MRQFRVHRIDSLKQGATGFLLVGGVVLVMITSVLMIMFAMGGVFRGTYSRDPLSGKITDAGTLNFVPITFVFFTLGIVMILGAVLYGLFVSATERSGPRRSHPVKVLAKYAFNREGNMLVSAWEIEGCGNPRFYVRLDFGAEMGTLECECSEQVFNQCGEGMTGMADLQGKWVGSFVPTIGSQFRSEYIADDALPPRGR